MRGHQSPKPPIFTTQHRRTHPTINYAAFSNLGFSVVERKAPRKPRKESSPCAVGWQCETKPAPAQSHYAILQDIMGTSGQPPRLGGEPAPPTAGLTLNHALHDGRPEQEFPFFLGLARKKSSSTRHYKSPGFCPPNAKIALMALNRRSQQFQLMR